MRAALPAITIIYTWNESPWIRAGPSLSLLVPFFLIHDSPLAMTIGYIRTFLIYCSVMTISYGPCSLLVRQTLAVSSGSRRHPMQVLEALLALWAPSYRDAEKTLFYVSRNTLRPARPSRVGASFCIAVCCIPQHCVLARPSVAYSHSGIADSTICNTSS